MSWKRVPINNLCSTVTKGTTPTTLGMSYVNNGIPFLRIQNLQNGSITLDDSTLYIEQETHNALSRSKIEPNDILLSIAGTIGRSSIVPADAQSMNCNQAVAILRPTEKVHPPFLRLWLDTSDSQSQIRGSKVTATISNLSLTQIKRLEIPLPPLPEQKRIAAILDKADTIRRKRQQAIKLADDFLRATFLDMFGDPVANHKGWKVKKFAYVGTLDRGISKHRPRNAPELLGGGYPLIQTGDVANSGGYIRKYKSTYSKTGLKQSKMWPAGTLCITIAANIAKTGILTFNACFPDSVVGFTPNNFSTTEYIQFWLGFLQKTLEAKAPESAQKNINLKILRNLDIPTPPITLQKEFSSHIGKVESLKGKQIIKNEYSLTLFNSLTQQAFRGEL